MANGSATSVQEDERWSALGVDMKFLEERAAWLRERRQLHHTSVNFFDLAAKLILWSRFDYPLASLAFFQAIVGLERALRIHYNSDQKSFSEMFSQAVKDGVITNATFCFSAPLPKDLLRQLGHVPSTHVETLAVLVPKLRNQFVHGTYLMSSAYLNLTFQMREIADVLDTEKNGHGWNTK